MTLVELLIIAVGLSMDAFAVSICKGLTLQRVEWKHALSAALWFGGFQALMPLLGYLLGTTFAEAVSEWDHWIAFTLLSLIGLNMLREAWGEESEEHTPDFRLRTMLLLAIATSIDALAVGVTFAFMQVNILFSVLLIGVVTLLFSVVGVGLGRLIGCKMRHYATLVGGVVLIAIGTKILLEHLCLPF